MLRRDSVAWCFTINNPVRPFSNPPIRFDQWRYPPIYACYQLEVGANGTPHLQGYLVYARDKRGSAVSNAFGCLPHLEPRNGKHVQVYNFKIDISACQR